MQLLIVTTLPNLLRNHVNPADKCVNTEPYEAQ